MKKKKPVSKKKVVKKVVKKAVKKKKSSVYAVLATAESYRVEMAIANKDDQNVITGYTYAVYGSPKETEEHTARTRVDALKRIGVGGRLVHIDGSSDGSVKETWSDVQRTAEAEKIEKAALEHRA